MGFCCFCACILQKVTLILISIVKKKEMFYLMMHLTHFIYGYMVSLCMYVNMVDVELDRGQDIRSMTKIG